MADRKIVIALDGSDQSNLAYEWYMANVNRPGDMVYLVHSAEYKVDFGMPGMAANVDAITKAMEAEDKRIQGLTGMATDDCKKRSVQAVALTVKGQKPGAAIIDAATKNGAGMIIMGSRGLGTVRRTLLGSVSEYVTHHAPPHCAVIILRDS